VSFDGRSGVLLQQHPVSQQILKLRRWARMTMTQERANELALGKWNMSATIGHPEPTFNGELVSPHNEATTMEDIEHSVQSHVDDSCPEEAHGYKRELSVELIGLAAIEQEDLNCSEYGNNIRVALLH
jgi:hypothetical protein